MFGGGGVTIAGHHVSYALLAVLLSVPVAGLAIYQFRSGALGSGVTTGTSAGGFSVDANGNIIDANGNIIGQAGGASVAGGGSGGTSSASDAALSGLSAQIGALAQLFSASTGSVPSVAPAYAYAGTRTVDTGSSPTAGALPSTGGGYVPTPQQAVVALAPSAKQAAASLQTFFTRPAQATPQPAPQVASLSGSRSSGNLIVL